MTNGESKSHFEANDWQAARDLGARLLDERHYTDAINALQDAVAGDAGGASHALLGLAYYQGQQYERSAAHYEKALEREKDNRDWRQMCESAKSNAVAEMNVTVPEHYFFEREPLLAPPKVDGALPIPPPPGRPWHLLRRIRRAIGNCAGVIVTFVMHVLTQLWGRIAGYRDEVWTNWYRRRLTFGILTLAYMREKLNKSNLKNTYPAGTLAGFMPGNQSPPVGVTHFRTADGSWNNLKKPQRGCHRYSFSPQCQQQRDPSRNGRIANDSQPERDQSQAADAAGTDEGSSVPQSVGCCLDSVREP